MGNLSGYKKGLTELEWERLIGHISSGECTPFIGSGACSTLPKGGQLARILAKQYSYPLDDKSDLQRVAQYIAIEADPPTLKRKVVRILRKGEPPVFSSPVEPHALLADFGLPVYITTNYDDFMSKALERIERDVKIDYSRWASAPEDRTKNSILFEEEYDPTPEQPLVYHLHGNCEHPESMVITEEDYLDFLINMSKDPDLLPPVITKALAGSSLLFIGYSLNDWTLRYIVRGLMRTMTANNNFKSIAVQIEPEIKGASQEQVLRACEYLDKYFDAHLCTDIDVYWGKAEDFVSELRNRWDQYAEEMQDASQQG